MQLPTGIDYTRYHGNGGMSTKHWGPSYWVFLFTSVMGTYPVKVDFKNKDHVFLSNEFKNTIMSLISILPCIFCRESLNLFVSELSIEPYLVGRIELMYWLYLIKHKVNTKLINQETEMLESQKADIEHMHPKGSRKYNNELVRCNSEAFRTIPTPPFEQVLNTYESLRAVCSNAAKKCVISQD